MKGLRTDVRQALRLLRRSPGFAAVAVATLALGIGASTAMFSAVNSLLLRPLPLADPDRLVYGYAAREGFDPFGTSPLEWESYRANARSLASSGLAAARSFHLLASGGGGSGAGGGEPERTRGSAVTASFLATLGVRPALGRIFTDAEDRPGGPAVALISHGLFVRRFGADPGVVGRDVSLDGRQYAVVGVLPPGFDVPYGADVWVPLQTSFAALPLQQRAATAYQMVARLAPGATLETARAELKGLARRLESEYPDVRRGWSYGLIPLRQQLLSDLDGRTRRALLAVSVAVGFLLGICCANVASLLLARGVARDAEMAVRVALGAGRARLVRQLVTESAVLGLAGGAAGVALAVGLLPAVARLSPIATDSLAALLTDFRVDRSALVFGLAATIFAAAACAVLPALRATRGRDLSSALKSRADERQAAAGGGLRRSLGALVVAEIALATALLTGGGLMARSLRGLLRLDLGFRPAGVATADISLSRAKYPDSARRVALFEEVCERVRRLSGVRSAGVSSNLPNDPISLDSQFEVEGRPRPSGSDVPITAHRLVVPGYLEALGVELLRGRLVDERDRADSLPVAVVTEELARQAWPPRGDAALGSRIRRRIPGRPDAPWLTVVGVVRDTREDRFNFRVARPVWYLPWAQQPTPLAVDLPAYLAVRTESEASMSTLAAGIRRAVHESDPSVPVSAPVTLESRLASVLAADRFGAVLLGSLAFMGVALASLGLYGVLAFSVKTRTSEIGLRMALGARPRDILRMVLGRSAALFTAGLGAGLVGSRAVAHLVSASLYGVTAEDPATHVAVASILAAVALAASALPAWRAARVAPSEALRGE